MNDVIVGVDESEGAAQALRWGVREAQLHGWNVTALMVWGFSDQHHPIAGERFDPSYGEQTAVDVLHELVVAAIGEEAARTVERRVVCDLPARALLDASEGSKLLVVGARGLGGFRGLLLGSVSQHCLHHTTSPIAIVRKDRERFSEGVERTERIVVAVDGSETAQKALRWALDEARVRRAEVQVLHAWHPPHTGGYPYPITGSDLRPYEDAARQVLDTAIGGEDTTGLALPVELVSTRGYPASVIVDAAKDADLVVMGARGLGGFKGMLLGSVTNQVSHHVSCPVIVIPPQPASAVR